MMTIEEIKRLQQMQRQYEALARWIRKEKSIQGREAAIDERITIWYWVWLGEEIRRLRSQFHEVDTMGEEAMEAWETLEKEAREALQEYETTQMSVKDILKMDKDKKRAQETRERLGVRSYDDPEDFWKCLKKREESPHDE